MTRCQLTRLLDITRSVAKNICSHADGTAFKARVLAMRHRKFPAGLDQILTKSNIRRGKTGEPPVLTLPSRERRPK